MLDGVLRDHAGVRGGAARDDGDPVDGLELLLGDAHLVEHEPTVGVGAAEQRVGDRVRLVVDLLLHERRVAALLGGGGVPRDLVRLALRGRAVEVDDRGALGRDGDDLVLRELERVARVADEGGDVGAEVVGVVAEADHERAVATRADDDAGLVGVDREQREGALEVGDDGPHRGGQVVLTLVGSGDQVRDDLGVGLAREVDAVGEQALLQGVEVLDDAVVDEGELAVLATAVRVRVLVGRAAVRGPPRVPDAGRRRRERVCLELGHEVGELARLLAGLDVVAVEQATPAES